MSTQSITGVFKGALSDKAQLIAFFKCIDEYTLPKYRNQPYFNPKSPEYGTHTKHKGYRPMSYGAVSAICAKFGVEKKKLYKRIKSFPNGVDETNKVTKAGAKSVKYEKWEQTPTHLLIQSEIGADPNSVINHNRDQTKYKITFVKRQKYDYVCFLAWKAMGSKTDLLNASLEQWQLVWGKDPKSPDQCHESLRDKQTRLISYGYTTPLRWIMKRSLDPQVKNMIIIDDDKFRTTRLKRAAGQHKTSYFTEKQCFMLPQAVTVVDSLGIDYFGLIFGARSSALKDLKVCNIDFEAKTVEFWESKIQKRIQKDVGDEELAFAKAYISYMNLGPNDYLFMRSVEEYNKELSALKTFFANTPYPLHWTPTSHTAFKHTCVTQMSLHGVRMDTISDYIGTDPNTLKQFYRGGSSINTRREILGQTVEQEKPSWRPFVAELTCVFAKRFEELTGCKVNLPFLGVAS